VTGPTTTTAYALLSCCGGGGDEGAISVVTGGWHYHTAGGLQDTLMLPLSLCLSDYETFRIPPLMSEGRFVRWTREGVEGRRRSVAEGGDGGDRPHKKPRKIFLNVSENKPSDRKISNFVRVDRLFCRIAISKVLRTFDPLNWN